MNPSQLHAPADERQTLVPCQVPAVKPLSCPIANPPGEGRVEVPRGDLPERPHAEHGRRPLAGLASAAVLTVPERVRGPRVRDEEDVAGRGEVHRGRPGKILADAKETREPTHGRPRTVGPSPAIVEPRNRLWHATA